MRPLRLLPDRPLGQASRSTSKSRTLSNGCGRSRSSACSADRERPVVGPFGCVMSAPAYGMPSSSTPMFRSRNWRKARSRNVEDLGSTLIPPTTPPSITRTSPPKTRRDSRSRGGALSTPCALRVDARGEREVVKEERRMRTDNSPTGTLIEAFFGAAYKAHNYAAGGRLMKDLGCQPQRLPRLLQHTLQPKNVTVLIVGATTMRQRSSESSTTLGRGNQPARSRAAGWPGRRAGEETVRFATNTPLLGGWKVPAAKHEDTSPQAAR